MPTLRKFLLQKKYHRIKLGLTKTQHLYVQASINGVEGDFIVDTGASSSCIDFQYANYFHMETQDSPIRAAGAGSSNMLTKTSPNNKLRIGTWEKFKLTLVAFDLSHVNRALAEHESDLVHGILGADVLNKGKAVIDYTKKCLYLK